MLFMKKLKNTSPFIFLSVLSLSVSACGQNPNVNSHSPGAIQNHQVAGTPSDNNQNPPVLATGGKSVIPTQNNDAAPSMPSSLGSPEQMPSLPAGTPIKAVLAAQPVDNGNPSVIPKQNNAPAPSMPGRLGSPEQIPSLPNGSPANVALAAQPVDNGNPSVIPKQNNAPAPSMPGSLGSPEQMPNLPNGTPPNVALAAQPVDNGNPSVIPKQNNAPAPSMPRSLGSPEQMPNLPAGTPANVALAAQPVDNGNPSVIPKQNNAPAPSMPGSLGSPEQMPNLPNGTPANVALAAQPVDNGNPSLIPKQNNTPAPPLPAQLTGLSGDPLSNLPPYISPVVVLEPQQGSQGPQGPQGPAGQNGQNGKDDCGPREFTMEFPVRSFTDAEKILYAKELPYRSTQGYPVAERLNHKIPTLQVGEMSALAPGDIPYVANSQVEMAIDIALPTSDAVVQIQDLSLQMYVSKLSQEQYIDTEVLCLLDEKICSGDLFEASNWQKNINPEFFSEGSRPANDYFVKQYTNRVVGHLPIYKREVGSCGLTENVIVKRDPIYANGMNLPISELVAGSGSTAQQVLYGQTAAKVASDTSTGLYERTMHIVVADDTYVREDAKLVVSLIADTCKMPNILIKTK
jgi:hypothetical protein